jgi:hypothetical protein
LGRCCYKPRCHHYSKHSNHIGDQQASSGHSDFMAEESVWFKCLEHCHPEFKIDPTPCLRIPSVATPGEDKCSSGAVECRRITSIIQSHLSIWSPPNSDHLSQTKQLATINRKKYMLALRGQCSVRRDPHLRVLYP